MKIKYMSLREAVVLPIATWFKGQAHSHSTFIHGDVNMPGLSMEEQSETIAIFQNDVPVAAIPLANIRGFVYLPEAAPVEDAQVVETEASTESPRRRARA